MRTGSKVFLSVDLVGSTAYKQGRREPDDWLKTFSEFYETFPAHLEDALRDGPQVDLTLWKPIGDELLYVGDVNSEEQVRCSVDAWLQAMRSYEEHFDEAGIPLKTKGGAFIGTFPSPDREISIRSRRGAEGVVLDYLGPSIDTGFRLLAASSSRLFTLSIEVAWAYCVSLQRSRLQHNDLRFLESREMKGVWRGRGYPLLAFDRNAGDPVNAALDRISNVTAVSPRQVIDLAQACVEEADWPSAVFLPSAVEEAFRTPARRDKLTLVSERIIKDQKASADLSSIPEDAPLSRDEIPSVE